VSQVSTVTRLWAGRAGTRARDFLSDLETGAGPLFGGYLGFSLCG